jgi:hypothetical protein
MSGLVLVSRWMFHDVSWCFMMFQFHDVSTLTLTVSFSKKENIVKIQRRLKETIFEIVFWIFGQFQFCRFQPQEKPGTYLQERRNSRHWQRLSNLNNQRRRNEDKTNPHE